jgi:hypothetical protein
MAGAIPDTCRIDYVRQELTSLPRGMSVPSGRKKPWGTGHAVLICQEHLRSPFGVINADDFYGRRSFAALATHLNAAHDRAGELDLSMVAFPLENTLTEHGQVSRGVCVVDPEGFLVEVRERLKIERRLGEIGYLDEGGRWRPIPADSLASMNMWGFTPGIFHELREGFEEFLEFGRRNPVEVEYLLPEAVNRVLVRRRARVRVLSTPEIWHGLTYPADVARCRERVLALVDAGVYPRRLWG